MEIDPDYLKRLRDACADGDKFFSAEIVLRLLDALDAAEREISSPKSPMVPAS